MKQPSRIIELHLERAGLMTKNKLITFTMQSLASFLLAAAL